MPACLLRPSVAVSALLELCAARLQFALCGVFLPPFVGFPALRSVLAVVGVSVSAVCHYVGRVPAASVRDDLVTACPSAVRFCLVLAFRLARGSLLPFPASRGFLRLFRLYRVVWAGCFCRPALPFIISPPPCCCQPIPQGLFLPYFALLLLLWCCMP